MPDIFHIPDYDGLETLPFTVAPVASADQMRQVLSLRHQAYSRHDYVNSLKKALVAPDALDFAGYSHTLVAVAKTDGRVLATLRVTSNVDGPVGLPANLPDALCLQGVYAYLDRYAAIPGPGAMQVSAAMTKAVWLWALGRDARWLVALARAPLARRYQRVGGLVLQGDPAGFFMDDYHSDPYFLVGAPLGQAHARMCSENPAFGNGFVAKIHPDIQVHGRASAWDAPVSGNSADERALEGDSL